ncbi:zinc-binding alcohol dehydrogenase family protein [Corynebacterium pelargi]|uniref:Zinc-type alcohol dehydrogenase-like protein n=1 Tax=Corynebacterium pelargi TaxID=1471400 RepID=A0A410W7L2_9CORY|nr:zinc-binding alcohol dehydrogenase family protein [Corynebacterium pelargi]QAU51937.1 Zinc-type alcohol dehydrogenase-like protein [Corynebacterium pelargi]GGG71326.1 NADPH:quinone reductase [Corynebacterium pelargi]
MKAIGYVENLPISSPDALVEREVEKPACGPRDVLIRVEAVGVNPIDAKQRKTADAGGFRVLGYDAAGRVEAVGEEVTRFAPGDAVIAIGTLSRQGTNAEFFAIDERMAAKLEGENFAEAAALPLTFITAWESLFERLQLDESSQGTLLMIGATGGVGLAALQLLRLRCPKVDVIATASDESRARLVRDLGATFVVNHRDSLLEQVLADFPEGVDWVFTAHSQGQEDLLASITRPFGHIVGIDVGPDSIAPLKAKSIAWHWESMFSKSLFDVALESQGAILDEVARLYARGEIRPVIAEQLSPIGVETLSAAQERMEAGHELGKIVVTGW